MNNTSWSTKEIAELTEAWNSTRAPAMTFAHEYSAGIDRSAAAIRLKIGTLIREGVIEAHGAEFGPARVLVLDVETLPMLCYAWGLYDQNLGIHNIVKDTCLLAISTTWLYSGKIQSWAMTPKEAKVRDDARIVQEAWKLLEQAEVVIAHNGRSFDLPKLNARFLFHGLKPPSMYRIVDTCRDIGTVGLTSKKQDYIGRFTDRKRKLETDFQLWVDCDNGEPKALKKMEQYNRGDVAQLEEVYTVLKPWISNHPNIAVFEDHASDRCPKCNGRLTWTNARWPTPTRLYPTYKCKVCGAVGRGRFAS